jgi:hypothetical protein|tara:strand:- start:40 stop:231 length:192 start_codon:yes stop_codon:yes gene_type:complete
VIEIGYVTESGEDVVAGSYESPVEANLAIAELKVSISSRQDISTLFMQADFGSGTNRYGYIDP